MWIKIKCLNKVNCLKLVILWFQVDFLIYNLNKFKISNNTKNSIQIFIIALKNIKIIKCKIKTNYLDSYIVVNNYEKVTQIKLIFTKIVIHQIPGSN